MSQRITLVYSGKVDQLNSLKEHLRIIQLWWCGNFFMKTKKRHSSMEASSLSQIVHKNIIRLLGCCLEAESLILIYEYANKGSLMDILGSQEDLPLDKRIGIAIKTAEALQYLHSSTTGIIGHGNVAASTILLDNNFLPKLTDFSGACKLITETNNEGSNRTTSQD